VGDEEQVGMRERVQEQRGWGPPPPPLETNTWVSLCSAALPLPLAHWPCRGNITSQH